MKVIFHPPPPDQREEGEQRFVELLDWLIAIGQVYEAEVEAVAQWHAAIGEAMQRSADPSAAASTSTAASPDAARPRSAAAPSVVVATAADRAEAPRAAVAASRRAPRGDANPPP